MLKHIYKLNKRLTYILINLRSYYAKNNYRKNEVNHIN